MPCPDAGARGAGSLRGGGAVRGDVQSGLGAPRHRPPAARMPSMRQEESFVDLHGPLGNMKAF